MIARVVKQPGEVLRHPLGVVDVVAIGATSVVARGLVAGAAALLAAAELAGGGVELALSGGGDGESYLVTVRADDAAGQTIEAELEVAVVEGAWTMPDGGTGYLSIADFVALFGLDEVVTMTDRSGSGRIDRGYLVSALRAAQSSADINLAAGGYVVPVAIVPEAIRTAIADLACARLYPRGAPEGVADRASEARALFQRIADRKLPLGLPADAAPAAEAASQTPVLISNRGRRRYPDGIGEL